MNHYIPAMLGAAILAASLAFASVAQPPQLPGILTIVEIQLFVAPLSAAGGAALLVWALLKGRS